jgi:hypothetical protein
LVNETNPRLVKYGNCPQFTPVIPVTLGISQTYRGHLTNPHVFVGLLILTCTLVYAASEPLTLADLRLCLALFSPGIVCVCIIRDVGA